MQLELDDYGARRLVAAILLLTVEDASRGDVKAATWLAGAGALWASDLGIDPARVRAWRPCRVIRRPRGRRPGV